MNEKQTIDEWLLANLNCCDYNEIAVKGHPILNISQRTWYNYRHGKRKKIPADVAIKLNNWLTEKGYQPYPF